jgi:hypothetical protein
MVSPVNQDVQELMVYLVYLAILLLRESQAYQE